MYGNLWEKKESSGMIFIFDPQCHTLVTFFLNLPTCQNLYQFARGDDCFQNTDHRYTMQLTRKVSGFDPFFKEVYKSSFGNLEDKLNTVGTNGKKCEYSNSEIVFEYSNGMRIFEYPNIH